MSKTLIKFIKSNSFFLSFLLFVILVILAVFTVQDLYSQIENTEGKVSNVTKTVDNLKSRMLDLEFDDMIQSATVNLTSHSFQKINDDYDILIEDVNEHLSGMKIKGKILNRSSVNSNSVKFSFSVGEQSKNLTISDRVNSGYARDFELYIPDVDAEEEFADVSFISANLQYLRH